MKPFFGRRLALAAGALVLVAQTGATAAGLPRLTTPVDATKGDENPARLPSTPAVAVDPGNPLTIVTSFIDMRTRRCGVLRSTDGGETWTRPDASPSPPSYPFCLQTAGQTTQAPIAFGRSGTLYMALAGWDVQDGGPRRNGAVLLARSNDLGNTWQTTTVYDARGKDPVENNRTVNSLAVDTGTGNDDVVVVGFSRSLPDATAPNNVPTQPLVAASGDGGRTFAAPIDLADKVFEPTDLRTQALGATTTTVASGSGAPTTTTTAVAGSKAAQPNQAANFGGFNPRMAADSKHGIVYALWSSTTANVNPSPPSGFFLSKSTDQGKTWTTTQVAPFSYTVGNPRLVVSPKDGSLNLVSGFNPNPAEASYGDIYYRRSADRGKTWSEPKIVTDGDKSQQYGKYIPNVNVAPDGRIDVVWWDTRNDPGIRSNDVYYTYSTDDGKTWSTNQRITDRSVDRRIGVWGFNFDMSSPPSVGSTNSFAFFAWDDTRNTQNFNPAQGADTGGGLQDIYTSAAQFKVVGAGTSKAVKYVLAGVGGLLTVGLILLAVGLAERRRSRGGRGPQHTATDRESALLT